MSERPAVLDQMRDDWNRRAGEDAHYYVAFGGRNQAGDEFFATASEQVRGFEQELRRLPPRPPRARRALEIGCGPGRLMRPLARHFGEIHGVDISDEMIARARANLAGIAHAHAHHAPDSNLAAFADESFDFVYSYAVFQHIPSREVVMGYLEEAVRVLRPGGILRCQINGLPPTARQYDTWAGVRIAADEVAAFADAHGMILLALEGTLTQYMWATLRKPPAPEAPEPARRRIRRATNAHSSEPAAPVRGRFAALSMWVEGLPPDAGLTSLSVTIRGQPATLTYIGHPERDSLQQVNFLLPEGLSTGLAPIEAAYHGERLCEPAYVRLTPPPPPIPRMVSLTDGINLVEDSRIVTGTLKITVEEVAQPDRIAIAVDGSPADEIEWFCTDPRVPKHEVNCRLPEGFSASAATVHVHAGARLLGQRAITVAAGDPGPR